MSPLTGFGIIRRKAMRAAAQGLLEKYEIAVDPDDAVSSLTNDFRKMVQIVKAVSLEPRVLILDEPTSSLTEPQVRVVLRLIRQLASQGVGLVLISHYLAEIFEVCDDLTVMRDGEVVATAGQRNDAAASRYPMIGRKVEASRRAAQLARREALPLMAVENLAFPGILQNVRLACAAAKCWASLASPAPVFGNCPRGMFGATGREASGQIIIEGAPVPPSRSGGLASSRDRAYHQRPAGRGHFARFPA